MRFMRYVIIILIAIAHPIAFSAIPPVLCNINGDWYQEGTPWYQFHFVQSGSVLLGTSPYPQCGGLIASGSVTQSGANFNVTASSKEGFCDYSVNIKATFINSCSAMVWRETGEKNGTTFIRIPIKIVEPKNQELIISNEPHMPTFTARVEFEDPTFLKNLRSDIPAYTWGIRITHNIGSDLHTDAKTDSFKTDSESYRPNFESLKEVKPNGTIVKVEGGVVGGALTLSVEYYENLHIEKKYTILKGTNPGQAAIEQVLTDKTLRQIACQESRYKHFDAPREGGIGKPNGKTDPFRGGLGIMQLFDPMPTSAQVWNWRENLKAGEKLYNDKLTEAMKLPRRELKELNEERDSLGLPRCTTPLPALNPEQLARETIRRYNCGKEYRWEPRNAPNCEGNWVISPSCKITLPDAYDAEYVDRVLKCDINH